MPSEETIDMTKLASLAVMLVLCGTAFAQQTVTSGPWTITAGPAGPEASPTRASRSSAPAAITGFLPNWTGARFSLGRRQDRPPPPTA